MVQANGKSNMKFMGWRRENGRVAVRNHVVILPLDDLSNAACEAVANNIKGTLAIPHAYGRLQFGEDLETFFRTIIGTGANPNVAACVVIGIEDGWTKRVVDGIAKTGKAVTLACERYVYGLPAIERYVDMKLPVAFADDSLYPEDKSAGMRVRCSGAACSSAAATRSASASAPTGAQIWTLTGRSPATPAGSATAGMPIRFAAPV